MVRDQNHPKASIIITYFEQAQYIRESLDSALAQDYPNLEIVISDDHSTKHPFPKKKIVDPRIRYFRNDQNLGKSANYRKALSVYASGEYALLLNGDDYLTDRKYISKAVQLMRSEENLSLVFGKIQTLIQSTGALIIDRCNDALKPINDGNEVFLKFPDGLSIPHLTCLFDRRKALEIGGYQYDMLGEDWELFLRLMQNRKVGYIKEVSGVYRKHYDNTTKKLDVERIEGGLKMIESPYTSAIENAVAEASRLLIWKEKMLRRYFYKYYLKLNFINPAEKVNLCYLFSTKYPLLYQRIGRDYRFWFLKLFGANRPLMKLVFTYIIKQPSFIQDMISAKNHFEAK